MYNLVAVIAHIGNGPNHGHYVTLIRSGNKWLFFDDEIVELMDDEEVSQFFGMPVNSPSEVRPDCDGWKSLSQMQILYPITAEQRRETEELGNSHRAEGSSSPRLTASVESPPAGARRRTENGYMLFYVSQ